MKELVHALGLTIQLHWAQGVLSARMLCSQINNIDRYMVYILEEISAGERTSLVVDTCTSAIVARMTVAVPRQVSPTQVFPLGELQALEQLSCWPPVCQRAHRCSGSF